MAAAREQSCTSRQGCAVTSVVPEPPEFKTWPFELTMA